MSYEIYYKRAFIKVGENQFLPIVQSGSNNCFEMSWRNRHLSEKNWYLLNYKFNGQYTFTIEEIEKLAEVYEECSKSSGACFKSRNTCFKDGEFGTWIKNGVNTARTLEEYISYGNSFYLEEVTKDESKAYGYNYTSHYVKTTDELLAMITALKLKGASFSFKFGNNRELYMPKKQKQRKQRENVTSYFVLHNEKTGTLYSLSRRGGYRYSYHKDSGKKFKTMKEANLYLKKYQDRLNGFQVEAVSGEAWI